MIINWSSQDLERIFSGLTRIRKQTKSKNYYEYRRNIFPYLIWVQNNLNFRELRTLTTEYLEYLEDVEIGAELKVKPVKPRGWWKALQETNLPSLVNSFHPDAYYGWHYKEVREYAEGLKSEGNKPETPRWFYGLMWDKIGPLNLLFWAQDKAWGYGNHPTQNAKKLWRKLPRRIRFRIMAKNIRLERSESLYSKNRSQTDGWWNKDYEWQFKDFQSVYQKFVKDSGWTDEDGSEEYWLPGWRKTQEFFQALFSLLFEGITATEKEYEVNKKKYAAYKSFTPEVRTFLLKGLIDLDKAFTIMELLRASQPLVDLHGRKSSLPTGWDFNKFTTMAEELGFDPELPTFDTIICPSCEGKGYRWKKSRVCSKCRGLGLMINKDYVLDDSEIQVPKLFYPSHEVSSDRRRQQLRHGLGTLLNEPGYAEKKRQDEVAYLKKEIEAGVKLIHSLTPNYK